MTQDIRFAYRFHPVGQGLFASGTLESCGQQAGRFNWVFDCGSMAPKRDLAPQVSWYRDLILQDDDLDLLCISHFDKDHVSGLGELLDGKHVGTVVIPYYTPIERLVIGSTQAGRRSESDGDYYDFLSNPLAFLIERSASVRQIIVIDGSLPPDATRRPQGDTPPNSPFTRIRERPLRDLEKPKRDKEEGHEWHLKPSKESSGGDDPPFARSVRASLGNMSGIVAFVESSYALDALAPDSVKQWEFLFHHKSQPPNVVDDLVRAMDRLLRRHRMQTGQLELGECLRNERLRGRIKNVYHGAFGKGKRFNSAGLCTYSGPVKDGLSWSGISVPRIWHGIPPLWSSHGPLRQHIHDYGWCDLGWRPAILYTGDANFEPKSARDEVREFLSNDRWQSVHILQVPHHGSKKNWGSRSVGEFHHDWSVFCSDPEKRPYHPDRAVVIELLNKNPILVDRIAGVGWGGLCRFGDQADPD